jgi:DNA-binding NarL/FixJ family response regulator
MEIIKIVVADDHPLMREALVTAIEGEAGLQVIGQANNGLEALELVDELEPDVVLIDLMMPEMDGLEAVETLQQTHPEISIMVVSSAEEEEKVFAAVQAGALGYFPKTAPRSYLLEGIRKVADGVPYLPSGIAVKLFRGVRSTKAPEKGRSAVDEPLTIRQEEVLSLIEEGKTDDEIAVALHLSAATVRSHVHHIIRRLGVKNRAQAVAQIGRLRRS